MKKVIIIILWFLFISVNANTYYVATNGNDANAGTLAAPFVTWQKGFSTVEAGDSLIIRGGVYLPTTTYAASSVVYINPYSSPHIGHDGTLLNPIVICNYPGEVPILDCINVTNPGLYLIGIAIDRCNFWTLKGLTIRNVLQTTECTINGLSIGLCSNMLIERFTVHNIGGKGFVIQTAFQDVSVPEQLGIATDTMRIINCDAYSCADSIGREVGRTDFGNYSDGFWTNVQNPTLSYVYFEGCRSWLNSDDGWDNPSRCDMLFNNCWGFSGGWGIGDGIGWRGDPIGDELSDGYTIKNCIMAFNSQSGFTATFQSGYLRVGRFYNNLGIKNGYGIIFGQPDVYAEEDSIYFRNNVFYGNTTFDLLRKDHNNLNISHNYWGSKLELLGYSPEEVGIPDMSPAVTATDADFVPISQSEAIAELSASRKSDGSLPDITFGRLVGNSDLKGAGTNVGMSATPDIGVDWAYYDLTYGYITTPIYILKKQNKWIFRNNKMIVR